MYDFKDKVALVTGAAQGIGKTFVQHLLEKHVKVMMSDIKQTVGEESRNELAKRYGDNNVKFIIRDVTNDVQFEDAFKATIKEFGKLDILINNAGIACEIDPGWQKTVAINFTAVVKGTYLGLKYMGKHEGNNGGAIVNVSSISAFMKYDASPVYAGTKSAVLQFTICIGQQFHYDRTGVRVISINPGFTDTPLLTNIEEKLFPGIIEHFHASMSKYKIQSVDNVGRGLIQVLKDAESGTVWLIENDTAAQKVELKLEKL